MVFSGVSISPKTGTLQTWHLQTCISRLQAQGIIDKAVVEYLHRRWPALSLGKLRVLHLEIPCFVFIPYIMALGEKKHGFPFFGMSKCEMCTQGIHLFLENWRTSPPTRWIDTWYLRKLKMITSTDEAVSKQRLMQDGCMMLVNVHNHGANHGGIPWPLRVSLPIDFLQSYLNWGWTSSREVQGFLHN
jgi:hypothetical protein